MKALNCKGTSGTRTRKIERNPNCRSANSIGDENTIPNDNLIVYPNPSEGVFNLEFNSAIEMKAQVLVYHLTGKIVYSSDINMIEGLNRFTIVMNEKAKGIYRLFVLGNAQDLFHRKIIIE